MAILEILARDGEAGVTEVARELDVHKSTASRLLAALDRRELVTQDTARGKFRLGVGIVRLAGAASARLDVVQESRPVCRALAQQVGETVNLAILSGRDALYLDQAAGPAALSPHNWAGRRIPLHATSDGKVLLAYLPEDELAASLVPPLARFTDRTITAVAEFPALLAEVRSRGFATAVDELEAGLTAVAAPVRNAEGTVIASISASGPSFRIPAGRVSALAAAVRRAAAEVSRRLGWLARQPYAMRRLTAAPSRPWTGGRGSCAARRWRRPGTGRRWLRGRSAAPGCSTRRARAAALGGGRGPPPARSA